MQDVHMGLTPFIISAGELAKRYTKEGAQAHKEAWKKYRKGLSTFDKKQTDHTLMNWAVSGRIPIEIFRNLALRQYYNLARSWKTVIASGLLGDFDPLKEKLSQATAAKVVALLTPLAGERKLEGPVYAAFKTLSEFATGSGGFGRHVPRNLDQELDTALKALGHSTTPVVDTTASGDDAEAEEVFEMETADPLAELTARIAELTARKADAVTGERYAEAATLKDEIAAAQAELDVLKAEDTVVLPDGRAQMEAKRSELTTQIAKLIIDKAAAVKDENYALAAELKAQIEAAQAELSALDNPSDPAPAASTEPSGPADPSASSGGGTPTSSRTAARVENAANRRGKSAQPNGGGGHPVTDPIERLAAHGVTEESDPKVVDMVRRSGGTKKVRRALDMLTADAAQAIGELRSLAEIAG